MVGQGSNRFVCLVKLVIVQFGSKWYHDEQGSQ